MAKSDVGIDLIAFGIELQEKGAAQVGSSFTTDVSADAFLRSSPNAFLFGLLFTQGIPAERAWAGPWLLKERLGTLDPSYLACHSDEVRAAVQREPMLHRFKETLPKWIVAAAVRLVDCYGGNAARIWPNGDHVLDVTERLLEFEGIGRKKAVMAVEILQRHFGIEMVGRECGEVAYDVHVRRVFLRTGLAAEDSQEAIQAAAARVCPDAPATLDLAAWLIGRDWCRPRAPLCNECRLSASCLRVTSITPEGVGARKDYSAERKTKPESNLG